MTSHAAMWVCLGAVEREPWPSILCSSRPPLTPFWLLCSTRYLVLLVHGERGMFYLYARRKWGSCVVWENREEGKQWRIPTDRRRGRGCPWSDVANYIRFFLLSDSSMLLGLSNYLHTVKVECFICMLAENEWYTCLGKAVRRENSNVFQLTGG